MPKKYQKKIIYPLFHEAAKYTLNQSWVALLISCSYGKLPKGLTISTSSQIEEELNNEKNIQETLLPNKNTKNKTSDLFVSLKKKNVNKVCKLPNTPELLCKTMINIFKNDLSLTSSVEDQKQLEIVEKEKEIINPNTTFNFVKDKDVRFRLLFNFTLEIKQQLQLTEPQRRQLYAIITRGFILKIIIPEEIEIKNHRIVKIDNIFYRDSLFHLDFENCPLSKSRSKSKPSSRASDSSLKDAWNRYMSNLNSPSN